MNAYHKKIINKNNKLYRDTYNVFITEVFSLRLKYEVNSTT